MRIRSFIAAALIAALGTTLVPTVQAAEATATAPGTRHVDFDKAIARAVEQTSSVHQSESLGANRSSAPAMQRGYGGGGGHMMMVMSMVGMLAGIGMTYYMVKQIQKTSNEASKGQ